MHQALFWGKKEKIIHCFLCPQHCHLKEGETGLCGVRREKDGILYTLNYGLCAAIAVDPIEKKPLYHFHPGSDILSLGTVGCNLDCGFCQNWQLARGKRAVGDNRFTPVQVKELLKSHSPASVGIAYTYSEPGMWFEFVLDTAQEIRAAGYKNVLVTNGFLNPEPLRELSLYIDAFNIDVKAFSNDFYRHHCRGRLDPVLRYVEAAASAAHVELTYLVIPGENDSTDEINKFASWVAGIDPAIPVHLSRYFPQRNFTLPPTPLVDMMKLREAAMKFLYYVYLGNIPGSDAANTYCPSCGKPLVQRDGYRVRLSLKERTCANCGKKAEFVL